MSETMQNASSNEQFATPFSARQAAQFVLNNNLGTFIGISHSSGFVFDGEAEIEIPLETIIVQQGSKIVEYVFSPLGLSNITMDGKNLLDKHDPFEIFVRYKKNTLLLNRNYIQTKVNTSRLYLLHDGVIRGTYTQKLSKIIKQQSPARTALRNSQKNVKFSEMIDYKDQIQEMLQREKDLKEFRDFNKFLTLSLYKPGKYESTLNEILERE